MIKGIIFASNTFASSENAYGRFAEEFNLKKQDLIKINKKFFIPAKKGKYTKQGLVNELAKNLRTTKKHVLENAEECARLIKNDKEIIKIIKKLKRKYKVGLVSNTNQMFASLNPEKETIKIFNKNVLSYKVKSLRPQTKQYKEILRKLNLKPKECLYIDKKKELTVPAKKLGMNTIILKNSKRLKDVLNSYNISI